MAIEPARHGESDAKRSGAPSTVGASRIPRPSRRIRRPSTQLVEDDGQHAATEPDESVPDDAQLHDSGAIDSVASDSGPKEPVAKSRMLKDTARIVDTDAIDGLDSTSTPRKRAPVSAAKSDKVGAGKVVQARKSAQSKSKKPTVAQANATRTKTDQVGEKKVANRAAKPNRQSPSKTHVRKSVPAFQIDLDEHRKVPRARRVLRFSTGFLSSSLLHVGLILFLALCTFTIPALDVWNLEADLTAHDTETQLLELERSELNSSSSQSSAADADRDDQRFRIDPSILTDRGALAAQLQLSGFDGDGLEGPVADVRRLPGTLDNELPFRERGEGDDTGTASFFGIEARGQSFVYVVDCSNSMKGRRWERALYELRRSIEELTPEQQFYVVFFDANAHPMFGERFGELKMLTADDANRLRFRRWMTSMRVGDWTRPADSMRHALSLQPDAIFLLSDGEFQDNTVGYLREANPTIEGQRQGLTTIPIHTVCFESPIGHQQLGIIAKDHGGTYRFVP